MKKLTKKNQIILICALSFALLISGIYLFGLIYFRSHFMPNTFINDIDVSMLNKEDAEELTSMIPSKIYIIEKNVNGTDEHRDMIDLTNEASASLSHDLMPLIETQDTSLWFTSFFHTHQLESVSVYGDYDRQQFLSHLDNLYCFRKENIVMPTDTHIEYSDYRLRIVDGSDGCYIDKDTADNKILEETDAFVNGSGINVIDLRDLYYKAQSNTSAEDLNDRLDSLQRILDKTITIVVNDSTIFSLTGREFGDLLILENNEFICDDVKIEEYSHTIAETYNVSDTEYIDRNAFKTSLRKILLGTRDSTLNIEWISDAVDTNDKLIEVSYSRQKLYYYEKGNLIFSSDIVTGNNDFAPDSEAIPEGSYTVQYKKRGATLVGAEYTEYVEYWIGFGSPDYYNGGHVIGFHDASWRDEFGGDIWKSDPSHGCVNMPTDMVARLYEVADIGTPINVYY